jgi:F0F1-type ATP synthase membrane subunit a
MEAISFMPLYEVTLFGVKFSQTMIASLSGTVFFLIFLFVYALMKKKNPRNGLTNLVDMGIESITGFFQELGGHVPLKLIKIVVFIFIYILWCNLVGLIGDLFVLAAPSLHYYFRPVSTDVFFNMVLAFLAVTGSVIYGFQANGFHYIEKYVGYKGLGIVKKVTGI